MRIRGARLEVLLAFAVAVLSVSASHGTVVDSAQLARCAVISAADERLACYDALAGARPASSTARRVQMPAAVQSQSAAAQSQSAPEQVQSAAPQSSPQPPHAATSQAGAAPAHTAAPPAAATDDLQNFGLSPHQLNAGLPQGPKSIKAMVTRVGGGGAGAFTVTLDNGQLWSLEPDASLHEGDAVTIRRAALGSFLLVTPERRSYRARRLR